MTTTDVLNPNPVWQIILSDLVVWWRAWVLWPESRMVRMSGCVLLLATFGEPALPPAPLPSFHFHFHTHQSRRPCCTVLSVVDTTFSCQLQMGFMFEGLAVGTAAAALSLATNFTATVSANVSLTSPPQTRYAHIVHRPQRGAWFVYPSSEADTDPPRNTW